jgi:hypothetical protein
MSLDLTTALKKLHQLQLEDGDIGAEYWHQIATLLKNAEQYRDRAEAAERTLLQIRALLDTGE